MRIGSRIFAVLLLLAMFSARAVHAEEPVSAKPVRQVEEPMHLEVLLVWGTDQTNSPDPRHIPVDEGLVRKLGKSPYRWKYYFEVNRQELVIPQATNLTNIVVSKHCVLDISNLGTNRIEVKLYGQGKLVSTHDEKLTENWPLILAGPAGNQTAWMVVIRRTKPVVAAAK